MGRARVWRSVDFWRGLVAPQATLLRCTEPARENILATLSGAAQQRASESNCRGEGRGLRHPVAGFVVLRTTAAAGA